MYHFADGTPCPPYYAGHPSAPAHYAPNPYVHHHQPHPYAQSYHLPTTYEDNTADIQYTTELQTNIRKAKPRRRVSLAPSARNSIAIHEDAPSTSARSARDVGNSVSLSDPKNPTEARRSMMRQSLVAAQPRRRRVSAILSDRLAASDSQPSQEAAGSAHQLDTSVLKKEARRRTIYIPDDTTEVVTIHPGRSISSDQSSGRRPRSPDIGFDLVTLSEEENEEPLKPAIREKKVPRKSLAVAPKRAPLKRSTQARQSVLFAGDIMGAGPGKENIPPGKSLITGTARGRDDMAKARLQLGGFHYASTRKTATGSNNAPLDRVKSPQKRTGSDSILDYSPKPSKMRMSKCTTSKATIAASTLVKQSLQGVVKRSPMESTRTVHFQPTASRFSTDHFRLDPNSQTSMSRSRAANVVQVSNYKVLAEDLAHPELYEDHWLHYQEVSLTQLLNSIFEPLQAFQEPKDHAALRKKLLTIYHDPQIPLLHKRLQASLQYGALSIPKDLLAKASRIRDDVGLRKKFLTLFTETYDLGVLRAAAEVVIGREVSQARRSGNPAASEPILGLHAHTGSAHLKGSAIDRLSSGSTSSDIHDRQIRAERRAIERFLHTFFIKHEDAVRGRGTIASIARGQSQNADDFGSPSWAWRRTVLRSLMLIQLLDKASSIADGCLFQLTSPYKSSSAVIAALTTLILPSLGDLTRPLCHLNYTVKATQSPLEEYVYNIENLATGLRDGVALTRLVELVLFTSLAVSSRESDQSMTISMPSGEQLISTWQHNPTDERILSRHLKFPCAGRPLKLYNVQLALSAVAELGGAAAKAARDVTAEDIVDGHRERTLCLLWAIVGNCGMESLVNWKDVGKETRYFESQRRVESITDGFLEPTKSESENHKTSVLSLRSCSKLLLAWAQSIASRQHVTVDNLTTSFADHAVFELIVDAYLSYFPGPAATSIRRTRSSSSHNLSSLALKLSSIGSSSAFISLFTSAAGNANPIPSKSFAITTLTFLASRLIPMARTNRAATTIQKAYRSRLRRLEITKRIVCMRLANHCAMVVQTRETVVNAAIVLQRAWRRVLDSRIEALVKDVACFQTMARGWLARERTRGGGKVRKQRVRGGW